MENKEVILDGVRKKIQGMANRNFGFWLYPKLWEEKNISSPYIHFSDGKYLIDHSEEYLSRLDSEETFKPQPTLRSECFGYGEIDGKTLIPFLERQGVLHVDEDGEVVVNYFSDETDYEVVARIYVDALHYAQDCYRQEYIREHCDEDEVKPYDIADYYGKWIEDKHPSQFRGLKVGDSVNVMVTRKELCGETLYRIGYWDGEVIKVLDCHEDYEVCAWSPISKLK